MIKRWKRSKKVVFNIAYHLIWCPKYRRGVLVGDVARRLKCLLRRKATELGLSIEVMEILPDHVHLFVKCDPVDSPHFVIQQFKGSTSRLLRLEFPHLTKMPTLWTRSYYCESCGHISEGMVKKYIEEQKGK